MSAVGMGQLSYKWRKDEKDITDPKCTGVKGQNLTIPSFEHKHQGHYKCEVKNDRNQTTESNSAKLYLSKYEFHGE